MSSYSTASAPIPHEENGEDNDEEDDDRPKVVDTDPTGRFERFEESLGVGAYKEVFKAFDQEEGVEVAWCQLRLNLKKKDAEKIKREIEILESLRCENIINFYGSWLKKDADGREHVFFVTELMTSGTLKQYIRKTKGQPKPKVLKTWARQILKGLNYLHTREPPIIHRDLKCDNIFINGNNGQAKIGDFGLAIIKSKDHASSVLGTPEFMAPELYEEMYNEKVDIYAFGMCILELVTREYPYSECINQAQIFRKVTSGIMPKSLEKVRDPATLELIKLCLNHNPDERPSAAELLQHEFLKEECIASQNDNAKELPKYITPSPQKSPVIQIGQSTKTNDINSENTSLVSTNSTVTDFNNKIQHGTSVQKTNDSASLVSKTTQLEVPAEITTQTIDAEIKTYQVRSTTFPLSPHDSESDVSSHNGRVHLSSNEEIQTLSPIKCNIKIVDRQSENEVTFMMTIISTGHGEVEIKFPFNLQEDTPEDVVAEMVKEQILVQEGKELAKRKIEDIVNLISKEKFRVLEKIENKARSRVSSIQGDSDVVREISNSSHAANESNHRKVVAQPNVDLMSSFRSGFSSSYGSMDVTLTALPKVKMPSGASREQEVRQVPQNLALLNNTEKSSLPNSPIIPDTNAIFYSQPPPSRVNCGRSASFSSSHSAGVSPVRSDRQRRLSNPNLSSSSPIHQYTGASKIKACSDHSRASTSSSASHSSGHSVTAWDASESIVEAKSQSQQQSNLHKEKRLQVLPSLQSQKEEQNLPLLDVGLGLGIQTEHGYISKFRHGASTSSISSLSSSTVPAITNMSSSTMTSSNEKYHLPLSNSGQFHHEYATFVEEPLTYEADDDTSDDELVTRALHALEEKQKREATELQQKHAQERLQLMNESKLRQLRHKPHSNGNIMVSPTSSPLINRSSSEFTSRITGLSSTSSPNSSLISVSQNNPWHISQLLAPTNTTSPALSILASSSLPPSFSTVQLPPSVTSSLSSPSIASQSSKIIPMQSVNSSQTMVSSKPATSLITLTAPKTGSTSSVQKSSSMPLTSSSSSSIQYTMSSIPTTIVHSTPSVASNTANTYSQRSYTSVTNPPKPDELIHAMTERQIAELQKLANPQKVNDPMKQGVSSNGGSYTFAIVANQDLLVSPNMRSSISLNEMGKQRQALFSTRNASANSSCDLSQSSFSSKGSNGARDDLNNDHVQSGVAQLHRSGSIIGVDAATRSSRDQKKIDQDPLG